MQQNRNNKSIIVIIASYSTMCTIIIIQILPILTSTNIPVSGTYVKRTVSRATNIVVATTNEELDIFYKQQTINELRSSMQSSHNIQVALINNISSRNNSLNHLYKRNNTLSLFITNMDMYFQVHKCIFGFLSH